VEVCFRRMGGATDPPPSDRGAAAAGPAAGLGSRPQRGRQKRRGSGRERGRGASGAPRQFTGSLGEHRQDLVLPSRRRKPGMPGCLGSRGPRSPAGGGAGRGAGGLGGGGAGVLVKYGCFKTTGPPPVFFLSFFFAPADQPARTQFFFGPADPVR
jgi:hypothetical protein